jgi:plasmid stabilization system protein ParE
MSRFLFSPAAQADLEELAIQLDSFSPLAAIKLGRQIFAMLTSISDQPYLGLEHSNFSRLFGCEVRSRRVQRYRIFYFVTHPPEIIAILHGARDRNSILSSRVS